MPSVHLLCVRKCTTQSTSESLMIPIGVYSAPVRYSFGSSGNGSQASSGRQPPRYSSVVQNAQAGPSSQQHNPNRFGQNADTGKVTLSYNRPPSPAVPSPQYDPVVVRRPNEISRPMKLQPYTPPAPAPKKSAWKTAKGFIKTAVGKVLRRKPKINSRY